MNDGGAKLVIKEPCPFLLFPIEFYLKGHYKTKMITKFSDIH